MPSAQGVSVRLDPKMLQQMAENVTKAMGGFEVSVQQLSSAIQKAIDAQKSCNVQGWQPLSDQYTNRTASWIDSMLQAESVHKRYSAEELHDIGRNLHLAVLDKAKALANGQEWAWAESDIDARVGDFEPPTNHLTEMDDGGFDDIFRVWDEGDFEFEIDELKAKMDYALDWPQIDAMRKNGGTVEVKPERKSFYAQACDFTNEMRLVIGAYESDGVSHRFTPSSGGIAGQCADVTIIDDIE